MAADPLETGARTELIVTCACGFEARGEPAELIPLVQQHGGEVHNMAATADDVLALARPADQGLPMPAGIPGLEVEGPVQAEVFVLWMDRDEPALTGPCGAAP